MQKCDLVDESGQKEILHIQYVPLKLRLKREPLQIVDWDIVEVNEQCSEDVEH